MTKFYDDLQYLASTKGSSVCSFWWPELYLRVSLYFSEPVFSFVIFFSFFLFFFFLSFYGVLRCGNFN